MTEEKVKPFKVEEPLRIARLDPTFKDEIMKEPNAELIKYCFQCGTCTGSCIVTRFENNFNPRRIIKAALLGLKELVLSSDVLWICTSVVAVKEGET